MRWPAATCSPRFSPVTAISRRCATTSRSCSIDTAATDSRCNRFPLCSTARSSKTPPTPTANACAKHAGRLEREIRKLVAEGATGPLSKLCDLGAARLGAKTDESLAKSLKSLRAALKSDGEVIDCDKTMPFRLFQYVWQVLQEQKAKKFRAEINKLIMKLSDILSADFGHSKEGMSADRLQASIGTAHRDTFDFTAMSSLLTEATANVPMAESRRQRVRGLLTTLRTQRFFPPDDR